MAQKKTRTPQGSSSPPSDPSIYIVRAGNGGYYVVPSPQFVSRGEKILTFQNFLTSDAQVSFEKGVVDPPAFSVPAGGSQTVSVAGKKGYYEYQVTVGSLRAWGGSDPGMVVDP